MELNIGKIVNTHGIRGELKVLASTDFVDERFKKGSTVLLKYGKEVKEFVIESSRMHKGCVLVVFAGLHNINDVEKYKGLDLYIETDGSDDDDYYYFELENCDVYYQNEKIGIVSEILESEAHEILRVKRDGKSDVLIPYVERFILDVKIEDKRIDVDVIEGML